MARLIGAQRMVLQAILDLPKDSAGYVRDAHIAQKTQIAIADVRDWIETLEGEGHVNVARTTGGLSASITAQGRTGPGAVPARPDAASLSDRLFRASASLRTAAAPTDLSRHRGSRLGARPITFRWDIANVAHDSIENSCPGLLLVLAQGRGAPGRA